MHSRGSKCFTELYCINFINYFSFNVLKMKQCQKCPYTHKSTALRVSVSSNIQIN